VIRHLTNVSVAVATLGIGQIAVTLTVLAGATVLAAHGQLDSSAVVGLYTLVLGYVFGRTASVGPTGATGETGAPGKDAR
jgi:hypothetical protein